MKTNKLYRYIAGILVAVLLIPLISLGKWNTSVSKASATGNDSYAGKMARFEQDLLNAEKDKNTAKTIYLDAGNSLPLHLMNIIKNNPQVTVIYMFTYEDQQYTVKIPGGVDYTDPAIPWYGPLWLIGHYGIYDPGSATQTTPAAGNGTYVVQRGDTLSRLAKTFNTTVAALAQKNGIKNPNLITVGQVISY